MTLRAAVDGEIRELIRKDGRITFARFMEACLYSPNGGFYSARGNRISAHFGTASTSHPVFGVLIARQLEQMWRLLGDPAVFHVIEVGSGDGVLAQSIVDACRRTAPRFAQALCYVAADYQPRPPLPWLDHTVDRGDGTRGLPSPSRRDAPWGIQRVKTDGIRAFRNVTGCILCNELIDNFPVHRFAIQGGRVKEVFVTLSGGDLTEVLDEPATPGIEKRLTSLGLSLPEGYRGEVNLGIEDWTSQLAMALDRGFVLTIDYGELANDLYSLQNAQGTLMCYRRHLAGGDPYQHIGQQDITCLVDFTSLRQAGERHGLATVGYSLQSRFLTNLGFYPLRDAAPPRGQSAARTELNRIAMMTLVDPKEYGDFKALAQAKGVELGAELLGFRE